MKRKKSAVVVEAAPVAVQENPALVKLSNVGDGVEVKDMNYLFHYTKGIKPDNTPSNLFMLHYKEFQQPAWFTCRNLLSTDFTVAKTEVIIRQIQENLSGTIASERHYRSNTSVKSSFTLSGYQIDIADEPDIDLVLFKLITNISAEIQILTSSNLTFNIINGFSGNHALQLNYGILKTMTSRVGQEDKILPVNNIFLLDKFTKRLIHDGRLSISIEDVTNVQRAISEQVEIFKRHNMDQAMVNEICEHLPKKFSKKFIALYENLPENLRNFYYCSYIWSVLLDSEKKIDIEVRIRDMIKEKITNLELARTSV